MNLSRCPPALLHRLAHVGEIPVEDEHYVVWQLALGEGGELAQVGEQDGDLALLALEVRRTRAGVAYRGRVRREKRDHLQILQRPRLAGEAHVARRADPFEHAPLVGARARQPVQPAHHPHPAGRAAPAPAAHRGVRDAGGAADLEDRPAAREARLAAVGIGDAHDAVAPFQHRAHEACDGDGAQGKRREREDAVHHPIEECRLSRAGQRRAAQGPAQPGRVGGQRQHLAPRHRVAQEGEERHHDGGGVEQPGDRPVPALEAQPVMDADGAVRPGGDQRGGLQDQVDPRVLPVGQQDQRVTVRRSGHDVRPARADDVEREERHDGEAEQHARDLAGRHAQIAPPVERPVREAEMQHQRPEQHDLDRRAAPEIEEPDAAPLHGGERDQPQRVVQQMRRDVEQQHQPGDQPDADRNRRGFGVGAAARHRGAASTRPARSSAAGGGRPCRWRPPGRGPGIPCSRCRTAPGGGRAAPRRAAACRAPGRPRPGTR